MSDFAWNDLSTEEYREYVSPTGYVYRINKPVGLYISASGTHYVKDVEGIIHTFQRESFFALRWFDPSRGVLFVNPSNPEGATPVSADQA